MVIREYIYIYILVVKYRIPCDLLRFRDRGYDRGPVVLSRHEICANQLFLPDSLVISFLTRIDNIPDFGWQSCLQRCFILKFDHCARIIPFLKAYVILSVSRRIIRYLFVSSRRKIFSMKFLDD